MKKIVCSLVLFFAIGIGYLQAQSVSIALTALGISVYNAIPTADYVIQYEDTNGETKYVKADSCDEALMAAYQVLANGAEYAYIKSKYPTVNGSCRNKRYEKSDIEELRQKIY